jgi:hypothetical protein
MLLDVATHSENTRNPSAQDEALARLTWVEKADSILSEEFAVSMRFLNFCGEKFHRNPTERVHKQQTISARCVLLDHGQP